MLNMVGFGWKGESNYWEVISRVVEFWSLKMEN